MVYKHDTLEKQEKVTYFIHTSLRDPGLSLAVQALFQEWEELVLRSVEVCTARFVKRVLGKQLLRLLIVLAIGLVLHYTRGVYFFIAPIMIKHSHTVVILFNAVVLDFVGTIDAIKLITAAVEEALHFISAGRFPHKMPHLDSLEPRLVNASSFRQALKESTVPCAELQTGWNTLQTWTRAQTSDMVCPVLRAATPLGLAGKTLNMLGSPFAYGSNPEGNNCKEGDFDVSQSSACIVVNSGLVILQVVLPIMIGVLLIRSYLGVALRCVWLSLKTAVLAVRCALALLGVLL